MIPDESPPLRDEAEPQNLRLRPANDNGSDAAVAIDRRIQTIARTIGRQIAREQLKTLDAANDNDPAEKR